VGLVCYHRGLMGLSVREFDKTRDLEHAASLLAERHARDRARDARFPAAYEVPAACRPHIEGELNAMDRAAVVAIRDGDVVGFAAMQGFLANPTHMTAAFFPPRCTNLGYAAHASAPGLEFEVYREMYAALSDHFVARGYFDHNVYVAPTDAATIDAFSSLGFGRTVVAGLRGVEPVEGAPEGGVEMHQASEEDAEVIFSLNDELNTHHARAPIFWPHLAEVQENSHEFQRGLLKEADANAHWVAYDNGTPIGMNTFMGPYWISPMLAPEKTIYLYQGIVSERARRGGVGKAILSHAVGWARDQGYEHIALHYASPNISGARFWDSNGFAPIEYRMTRHIDDRIAWAGAHA
jgi:GNAT superfamily N-acetyltransferase